MKRILILLILLLGIFGSAVAEHPAEEDVLRLMLDTYPGYTVLSCDQWGSTAAAALGKDDERILCVAEKRGGLWQLVVSNANALRPGEKPSILVDTDTALFWSYSVGNTYYSYTSYKEEDQWGTPSCLKITESSGGLIRLCEEEVLWENGLLYWRIWYRDENENLLQKYQYGPVPASWLTAYNSLEAYDESLFPTAAKCTNESWLDFTALSMCAVEIAPEYTFVNGAATMNGLELLMKKDDGSLYVITCSCVTGYPITNISAVLPKGTRYGYENFSNSILIPGRVAVDLDACSDGVWHVDHIYPVGDDGTEVYMGRNWISKTTLVWEKRYVGDHPWSSLSMEWDSLPTSFDEALDSLDASRWAVVNNPDPADRLHLRERATKDSRSFGKYYNGTPVEVLKKGDTWTRVRVPGFTGWMMTKYLAFGKDGWEVEVAFPELSIRADAGGLVPVWKPENILYETSISANGDWQVQYSEVACIIGIVGDEWYHIWFPDRDVGGYMRQSDFTPGNG